MLLIKESGEGWPTYVVYWSRPILSDSSAQRESHLPFLQSLHKRWSGTVAKEAIAVSTTPVFSIFLLLNGARSCNLRDLTITVIDLAESHSHAWRAMPRHATCPLHSQLYKQRNTRRSDGYVCPRIYSAISESYSNRYTRTSPLDGYVATLNASLSLT